MYQTSLDFNLDDATYYAAPNAQSATFPTTRPDPEKTLTDCLHVWHGGCLSGDGAP